jgi:hypothetical protein
VVRIMGPVVAAKQGQAAHGSRQCIGVLIRHGATSLK